MKHHAEPGDRSGFEEVWRVTHEGDETILEEAQRLVYGDRNAAYGHPADDWDRTAKLWTPILEPILKPGAIVTGEQAILCMVAVKISREVHQEQRDNRVDGAGYFAALDRVRRRRAGLE